MVDECRGATMGWTSSDSRVERPPGYRGPDRRAQVETGSGVEERSWVAAGLTVGALVVAALVIGLLMRLGPLPPVVVIAVRSAAVVLAAVLAVVARVHWRATGQVVGARISAAAWLLAGVVVSRLVIDTDGEALAWAWLGFALTVTAAAWLGWAVLGPDVDSRVKLWQELGLALVIVGAGWGVLLAATPSMLHDQVPATIGVAAVLSALTWLVVTVVALVRAIGTGSVLLGWLGWMTLAFGLSELARFAAWLDDAAWLELAAGATVWGLLLAIVGLAVSVGRSAMDRRGQLHAASLFARARERVDEGADRAQAHEIRNALFAIEGATQALERFGPQLSEQDRADLSLAVTRGVDHLRGLVDARSEVQEPLALWHLAAGRASLVRARGVSVHVSGDQDALAMGDEVYCTQIVDNLLANALRHGRGTEHGVHVDVMASVTHVRLAVRDHGPGVPHADAERIFETGVRLSSQQGDGLGLTLARTLARRQGGELVLEPTPGAGACFVLTLPRVTDLRPIHADGGEDDVCDGHRQP
jgi:signal transduction histidine kinase